ncbi:MAG: DUF4097 domain-containing protein [Clostridia bacterium]|nr:DUF4097 domain-containing protein [Clostridia bacterium]
MKKRFLIVGITLLLAGGLAFVVGMSTLGWNFLLLDSEVFTAKVYELETSPERLASVSVDVRNAEIKVIEGSDVKIEYEESERIKYDIEYDEKEQTLVMNEVHSIPNIFRLFDFHSQVITITVPKVGTLSLESTNGNIEVPSGVYDEIDIETTNGTVEIRDVVAMRGVEVHTTNSRIVLSNVRSDEGTVEAYSTNGMIELENIVAKSAKGKTTNGKIAVEDVDVKTVSFITTNSPIVCDRLKIGENAYFKSTNGNIKAEFVGNISDFGITGQTTNGNFIPGNISGGRKKVECYTTNGDIKLTFSGHGGNESDHE